MSDDLCINCHKMPAWTAAGSQMCIGCLKDSGYLAEIASNAGLPIPADQSAPAIDGVPLPTRSTVLDAPLWERIREIQNAEGRINRGPLSE